MFGKNKIRETKVIVTTKEELKAAVKRKEPHIEVQGDLANKMRWMAKLSKKKMAALAALLVGCGIATATPIGLVGNIGVSAVGLTAATVEGTAGGVSGAAVIYLITILGAVTVVAILKGYNVEMCMDNKSLKLTQNSRC